MHNIRTNKKGLSFITLMIIIALCALVLRFAIEQIVRSNIAHNESNALPTLRLISAALESYARDNHGAYPTSITLLTQSQPAYLDKDYTAQPPLKGYNFGCLRLEAQGYICSASPVQCNVTGKKEYTISTGGLLVTEGCDQKD
ncbi:MAG: type II secretion system protein [Candidatus Omnitrophica bacterium]|nr:type II secretion system protein [Candidatus Omnitrophota bacterium]